VTISNATNPSSTQAFRFCIGATFTAEPLALVIPFWARPLNQDLEVRFAPYNQIEQELLNPRGVFAANVRGVNVIAIRLEDFGQDMPRIRSNVHHLLDVLRSAHSNVPMILCLCPASLAFHEDPAQVREAAEIAGLISSSIAGIHGLQFLHYDEVQRLYPVESYEAPGGGSLGHIPYTETYYTALGAALVRRAHAITRPPYKVIALDCDNTLWSGICGEDGPTGISLDGPHRELQEFILRQRESGMLLAMASKNNEQDVIDVFESNPGMPLKLGHFAAWRINWDSKAENLAALANELDLGLDSFIFVDDNAKECAEVESSASDVLAVPLPVAPEETLHFLNHVWAFDHPVVTGEDRKRNSFYAQRREFAAGMQSTADLEQFIANLDLKVRIAPLTPDRIPRVAQLTQRTNQFNFTGVRRSESDVQRLIADGVYDCFTVDVSDRFGDYGLVGVMILSNLCIDTFLLSCRVLGRGVEHRMMAFIADFAGARGDGVVVAPLTPTQKNAPAQQFLDSIAGGSKSESNGEWTHRFPLESLRGLKWKPAPAAAAPAAVERIRAADHKQQAPDYVRIARTLSTPAQILSEMRRQSLGAMESPATQTEAALAEIWADLLKVQSISAADNFFDLGGHSLLAVLLLVRIHETFGVELSIDDVYSSGLTLSALAQRIDMAVLGDLDSAEYRDLLQEIEALSDEEARRMLAESEPPCGSS
jgi:FkbH-like protein